MRILGITSYNGYLYQGWQKQKDALTIQEEIEKVLSQYFNQKVKIFGAGRTDAGVHALRQAFHFDVSKNDVDFDRAIYSLNLMLPQDIKIVDLKLVDDDFHARYDAKEKLYSYTFSFENKEVFSYEVITTMPYQMDLEIMEKALTHLLGKHCFKNFTSKTTDKDNFIREIFDAHLTVEGNYVTIFFAGNGFMQYQIRYLVGTLIEIGRGRLNIEDLDNLLDEHAKRKIVSYKAPANGLMLVDVIY